MTYQTIKSQNVAGKTVLVRVDYNVPIQDGSITDDLRIRASLPTLEYLRQAGAAKIILISHLGRPEGETPELSLRPVAERLAELLSAGSAGSVNDATSNVSSTSTSTSTSTGTGTGNANANATGNANNSSASPANSSTGNASAAAQIPPTVNFVSAVTGAEVETAAADLKNGEILLLENLRFYPGETANDPDFIKSIIDAVKAAIYVQDGFAIVHRAHASTSAVAKFLPVYMGLLLEKEVKNLTKATENPEKPVLMIIGGAKVEDKKPLIEKFVQDANQIVVGGKIAADGYPSGPKIYVAEDFDEDATGAKLDVGPLSMSKIAGYITDAKTIIWNGLLGKAEDPTYATASTITAELLGERTDATTVICGGDTTGFVEQLMKQHPNLHYSLVSTGGGAALEFLLGKDLPGLAVIQQA